ncbi:MAG: hypothetical protein QXT19_00935 [Candidatus Woesearchaeota archaeon]
MKQKILQAWLIIWLVVMLPVAFAQQLTVQKFAGTSNVNGFAKENDELTIQVLAEMLGSPTPEVARQRARVYYEDTYSFMNTCTSQAQAVYQCTYKTTNLIYGGTDTYTIKLFDAENREIASVEKTLTVDVLPPKITHFSVTPNMSSSAKPVKITYKAEDYGYETGKTTGCSGIKQVSITANNTQILQASAGVANCTKDGNYTFTPQIQGQSGRLTVCAVATDYVNHKSMPACQDIFIDSRKPTPDALEIRDAEGYAITHARSNQQITADVYVRIPDADINPASVYADLSKLNPLLGKKPKDLQKGDWFVWRNIAITTPSTCQVTVNASDLMGNKDAKTLTCTIGIDDTPPEPLTLGTQFADEDGTPLLGINGTIFAEFTETGSGMSKRNAFLDLRQFGIGTEVKADACEKTTTGTWKCQWNVRPTVASGTYEIKLLPTTRDNLNNQVTKTLQTKIRFDKTAPEGVRLLEIAAFRGQQRVKTNYTTLGETLEFVVQGMGFTSAVADFTDLGGGKDVAPERCEGDLTQRTCTFGVTNAVSGPQPTLIRFGSFDQAGNKAVLATNKLYILGISNETSPNYWTATTECSPELLDRTTLSVFEHPVFCHIKLASTNKNAMPLTVQGPLDYFSECTGQMEYISDMRIENNFAGSTEPYLVLSLVARDYKINNLTFTCPISILTRVGSFIPQNFEHDNMTVMLKFYNLPLGEAHDSVAGDVKDVADKVEGVWNLIGQMQKYIRYSENLCQILNMVMGMISLMTSIMVLLGATADTIDNLPIVGIAGLNLGQAIHAVERTSCNSAETTRKLYNSKLLETLKKFCNFITCQTGIFDFLDKEGFMSSLGLGIEGASAAGQGIWDKLISGYPGASSLRATTAEAGIDIQDPDAYLNVKDSLVFSIAIPPLCIPGIIYNLDKWRQIECRYGLCLLEDVREQGMPISVCKDQRHYMQCTFVTGEIFNLIPFAPLIDYYITIWKRIFSDPLVLAMAGIGYILDCQTACNLPKGTHWAYTACAVMSIIAQLGDTVRDIKSFKSVKDDFGSISSNWCDDFKEAYKSFEASRQSRVVS